MSYTPTIKDAAADFLRCAYLSQERGGHKNPSFSVFYKNAKKILKKNIHLLSKDRKEDVLSVLERLEKKKGSQVMVGEDLLMVAILLKNS